MTTTEPPRPPQDRAALEEALQAGPVIVAAAPGALALEFVREVSIWPLLAVDAAAAGTEAGLVVDITRQALRRLAPSSEIGANVAIPHRDDLVALARAYPRQLDDGIAAGMGIPPLDFSIDDALAALPRDALLVVASAHLLAQRWAKRTLWAMRGRAEDEQLRIVLLVPAWAATELVGSSEAFYGFAEVVSIKNRADVATWVDALEPEWEPTEAEWVARRTRGQFAAMAEVVDFARRHEVGLRDAWESIVLARVSSVPGAIQVAQSLSNLGGRILRAIALGQPPYPSVPRAAPNRIASGLKILQRAGLVYSLRRADWQVSDPLLGAAFFARGGLEENDGRKDWMLL